MLNVLVVSYTFPPTGGAGVQRVAKFVKFLPRFGVQPTVLTVANPSVPLADESLARDIPSEAKVIRARTLEPGYAVKASLGKGRGAEQGGRIRRSGTILKGSLLGAAKAILQPDPQILWMPAALRVGRGELGNGRYDAVFVSGPPFSSFLLAKSLASFAKLPLVADFRDEWSISNANWENKNSGSVANYIQRKMRAKVLRTAAALVATTRLSAEAIQTECRSVGGHANATCIYNGYDVDDVVLQAPQGPPPRTLRILYIGTLWNLTSIEPLSRAIELLAASKPGLLANLEVQIVGRRAGTQVAVVETMRSLPCQVTVSEYVPHSRALELMADSSVLCLLLSQVPGAERVVPAKLFEYIASQRPILAILPQGEAAEIVQRTSSAWHFKPSEVSGIAEWLVGVLSGDLPLTPVAQRVDDPAFLRVKQAEQLARIFVEVCEQSPLQRDAHANGGTSKC
jgi:glycosyltransferase involved in cell wall biosynthesis